MSAADGNLSYNVTSSTIRAFHDCRDDVRLLLGPLGSGKSVADCWEIVNMAFQMPPCKDGVRRSKAVFIRDTATNLIDTTMKTWLSLFPEKQKNGTGMTVVRHSDPVEMWIEFPHWDGKTKVELNILCRYQACDADAENLRSLDLSFAYVNEANMVPFVSIQQLLGRVGRYPALEDLVLDKDADGKPILPFFGIVMDANMPSDDHWIYKQFEVKKPKGWKLFRQPPAMFRETDAKGDVIYVPNRGQRAAQGIPPADNICNLTQGWKYYEKLVEANNDDWINVNVCANYGILRKGVTVYPNYSDLVHYTDTVIPFDKSKTLFLGFDWGLTPSVVFVQMSDAGQLQVIDEIDGGGAERHGIEYLWTTTLRNKLIEEYGWGRGTQIFAVCDPAVGKSQVDENTCVKYLSNQGLMVLPCHTNKERVRHESVDHFLCRLAGGKPAFLLSKKAQTLRKGFAGRYYFKESALGSNTGIVADNDFTHVQDALQYIAHAIKNPSDYNISWRNHSLSAWGLPLISATDASTSVPTLDMGGFI